MMAAIAMNELKISTKLMLLNIVRLFL